MLKRYLFIYWIIVDLVYMTLIWFFNPLTGLVINYQNSFPVGELIPRFEGKNCSLSYPCPVTTQVMYSPDNHALPNLGTSDLFSSRSDVLKHVVRILLNPLKRSVEWVCSGLWVLNDAQNRKPVFA